MVNFEEGTLIKGAYVVVNGEELPVHMPEYSGNTPMSPENLNKLQKDLLEITFPIGSQYITQKDVNPSTILGFGIWERLKGKVYLGLDEDDEDFNEIGKTGGEKEHTLTIAEMAPHDHFQYFGSALMVDAGGLGIESAGNSVSFEGAKLEKAVMTSITGQGTPHNNLQPYEVVGYMWIRRA